MRISHLQLLATMGWDEYYWRQLAPPSMGPAREVAYLHWRYEQVPLFEYCTFAAVEAGEPRGILVLRVEQVQGWNAKVAHIVDMAADAASAPNLIEAAIDEARRSQAMMVDFFCTNGRYFDTFETFGFLDACEPAAPRYRVPFLFQPLDHDRRRLNCAWWVKGMDMRSQEAGATFVAMKGDNEFDRPNEVFAPS